jgi:hypothetical protein
MMCLNCARLAFLFTKRVCIKCNSVVLNNLSVLCESCSNVAKICSVCLKKIEQQHNRGCGRCGSKS